MTIRTATVQDAAAIARLSEELGYPCARTVMAARVQKVTGLGQHLLLVAESGGKVCGWLHAYGADSVESGFRVEIAALVVAQTVQRSGIGTRLVEAAENWAGEVGAEFICVRSNINRKSSHPFYRKLGYELQKTQRVYRKRL